MFAITKHQTISACLSSGGRGAVQLCFAALNGNQEGGLEKLMAGLKGALGRTGTGFCKVATHGDAASHRTDKRTTRIAPLSEGNSSGKCALVILSARGFRASSPLS